MNVAAAEYDAWTTKLVEWAGCYDSTHEMFPVVVDRLREVVNSVSEAQAAELLRLFADAFSMTLDDAVRTVTPALADVTPTPAARLIPPPVTGVAARYAAWLAEQEAPLQYHVFTFLTCVSAAFRRRSCFNLSGIRIYPNLYTILVGPTGSRKDSAFDYAVDVVYEACPEINILPTEGSPQGMVALLQERHAAVGTSDGIIPAMELKVLFGKDSYKEAMAVWLTDWFKSPPYWSRGLSSAGRVELHNIYVCFVGGTTEDWLRTMPADVLTGGFLTARALLIPAADKKHWRFLPTISETERNAIVGHIAEAMRIVPAEYVFSREALAVMTEWYEVDLPRRYDKSDERGRAFIQRAHIHAVKFAMIMHALEVGTSVVNADTAEASIALALWCQEAMRPCIERLETREPVYDTILAYLLRHEGHATERDIVRNLRNRYRADDLRKALQALTYSREIAAVKVGGESAFMLR